MKHILKITLCSLLYFQLAIAQNAQKNFIDQPFIEVTGTVETELIPNEIFLKIVLNERDKKGKLSVELQENQMISALKTLDIDTDKNLSVLDFNGSYEKRFLGENEVVKVKHYQLIVTDGKLLGEVYQALDAYDISDISIIRTSHSELEKFKRDTKLKALRTAKEKATQYAEAIGQTIGKALYIQELALGNIGVNTRSNYSYNLNYAAQAYYKEDKLTLGHINLQPITIKETVMAKFILN